MSGYSINLYKFMRIDEKLREKELLLQQRMDILKIDLQNKEQHQKFIAYGEFDRIGIERIEKFSKFRDMAAETRTWIGDRQKYLVYDIPGTSDENDIEYHDGDFYERGNGQSVRSERLFFGITILQFKNSVKKEKPDMTECLRNCQKQICALVKNSGLDVQCSVFGTLGSSGLTIFWLADQYTII